MKLSLSLNILFLFYGNSYVLKSRCTNVGIPQRVSKTTLNPALKRYLVPQDYSAGPGLYFSLVLYALSLPGLFSLVSRSIAPKVTQKEYSSESTEGVSNLAGRILAYFNTRNYQAYPSEDKIEFRGRIGRSKSQAAFLTFCTFVALASMALIVSTLFPSESTLAATTIKDTVASEYGHGYAPPLHIGDKAYALTLLAPYAGIYYWNAQREEQVVKIKIVSSNGSASASVGGPNSDLTSDESVSRPLTAIATATATNKVLIDPTQQSLPIMSKISVTAQGGKDELEAMAKALKLTEQGKVYVKGAFE